MAKNKNQTLQPLILHLNREAKLARGDRIVHAPNMADIYPPFQPENPLIVRAAAAAGDTTRNRRAIARGAARGSSFSIRARR